MPWAGLQLAMLIAALQTTPIITVVGPVNFEFSALQKQWLSPPFTTFSPGYLISSFLYPHISINTILPSFLPFRNLQNLTSTASTHYSFQG